MKLSAGELELHVDKGRADECVLCCDATIAIDVCGIEMHESMTRAAMERAEMEKDANNKGKNWLPHG